MSEQNSSPAFKIVTVVFGLIAAALTAGGQLLHDFLPARKAPDLPPPVPKIEPATPEARRYYWDEVENLYATNPGRDPGLTPKQAEELEPILKQKLDEDAIRARYPSGSSKLSR